MATDLKTLLGFAHPYRGSLMLNALLSVAASAAMGVEEKEKDWQDKI